MDDFVQDLILAYCKERGKNYSFHELASCLGISRNTLTQYIQKLISEGALQYIDALLTITLEGRVRIQNKTVDYFAFDQSDVEYSPADIDSKKAQSFETVYLPNFFLEKL